MTAPTRRTWRIDLPFISPPLRDNGREHWAKKARIVSQLRRDAFWLTIAQHIPEMEFVTITLHWQPGIRRERDALGPAPTLKALVDGIVDACIVPTDSIRHVNPRCAVHEWQRGVKAACWITIEEGAG